MEKGKDPAILRKTIKRHTNVSFRLWWATTIFQEWVWLIAAILPESEGAWS